MVVKLSYEKKFSGIYQINPKLYVVFDKYHLIVSVDSCKTTFMQIPSFTIYGQAIRLVICSASLVNRWFSSNLLSIVKTFLLWDALGLWYFEDENRKRDIFERKSLIQINLAPLYTWSSSMNLGFVGRRQFSQVWRHLLNKTPCLSICLKSLNYPS